MAAPESPTRNQGRPPDTPIFGRKLVVSQNYARYSYATKSVPTNPFLNGQNAESYIGFNELLEDNIRLMQDVNKNNLQGSSTKTNKSDKSVQKSDKNLLKHGFPKILCLKKNSVCNSEGRSALKTLNVNSLESLSCSKSEKNSDKSASKTSLDNKFETSTAADNKSKSETDYSYYSEKPKNRNSFHQNVEEALSSLLWQPYEYQNQNNNEYSLASNGNDNYDYETYSSCSYTPSTSPNSLDLDETFDNAAPSPSNTKKNVPSSTFLQCTAAVPPLHRRDLHSDVINLNRQETIGQSEQVFASHDGLLQRSGTGAFVSLPSLASSLLDAEYDSVPHAESVTSCSGEFSGKSSMHSGSGSASGQQSVSANGLTASTSENGLKSGPIKADSSLNAANIVGLPSSHARYASVPCSGTSASFQNAHAVTRSQNVGYPQHFRNVSEPSQQFLRYANNNNGQAVPLMHQKPHTSTGASSQIDQHNLQLINHFRSSSVPKSMTLVPKYDVTTSSGPPGSLRIKGTQQNVNNINYGGPVHNTNNNNNNVRVATNKPTNISVPVHQNFPSSSAISPLKPQTLNVTPTVLPSSPSAGNVSNVNVNFYRAVPVNVVSSVPTIHCLNTLSNDQGNSVSNVQVLPLGNGNHQLTVQSNNFGGANPHLSVANSVKNVDNQKVFDGTVSSGGQVTVHNINAIRINSGSNTGQMVTSTVGYPEQGFRNVVSGNGSARGTSGIPVSVVNGLVRNALMQNVNVGSYDVSGPGFFTPALPAKGSGTVSSVVNIQNAAVFATEVPYHQAGRIITTTAQINSTPMDPMGSQQQAPPASGTNIVRTRTFTSTEAQTDEILPVAQSTTTQVQNASAREQRRRERRERRQNRRSHGHNNASRTTNDSSTQAGGGPMQIQGQVMPPNNSQENRLPDILNSHLPPPYSTLPSGQTASILPPMPPQILPPPPPMIPGAMLPNPPGPVLQTVVPNGVPASAFVFPAPQQMAPLMQGGAPVPVAVPATAASGFRFGFPANGFRRSRFSDDPPKGCCGFLSWKPGSLRWFIALIALVAVCCVLVGTALGAMRPAGRDHLTVSLLMIGVGIVLITVSGVAWRLTSHDSSTCRSMLGLGSTESVDVCARRFVPRLPPSYGRPHHPYAAMMYPEFQYRPPPPSYQASMQEYRLRLLLLDRGNTPQIQAGIQNAVSPPPTYRSHAGSLLRAPLSSRREANQSEYSCPPSYRSQNSSNRPGTLTNGSILHSRDPSLTMSDSNQESVVNIVNILGSTEEDIALDNITLDSLKMEPEPTDINPLKMLLKGSQSDLEGSKDGNLVTIVQTSDQNPVIVTVSGCSAQDNNSTVQITEIPSEMEILAHL